MLAILLSIAGLRAPEDAVDHPFGESRLGGWAVIQKLAPSLAGSEIEVGDRIVEFNGERYVSVAHRTRAELRLGTPNLARAWDARLARAPLATTGARATESSTTRRAPPTGWPTVPAAVSRA